MSRIMLHVVLNDFRNDARVLKETESIARSMPGAPLWIAALESRMADEYERLSFGRSVWRVPVRTRSLPKDLASQSLKYLEWVLRVVARFLPQKPRIVHCHDLNALPVGVLLKLAAGARVIYDAHELETERHGQRGLRKAVAKAAERLLISCADTVVTVSTAIGRDYQLRYGIAEPLVVRNIPRVDDHVDGLSSPLRAQLRVANADVIFIYQGGLSEGRGIEFLLEVFQSMPPSRRLLFLGSGPLEKLVTQTAGKSPSVHHIPAVPPESVLRYTRGAHAGVCLIEDTSLSYRYSLPNKLFEYLKAGIPVIINDLPEQRALVEHYSCGWVLDKQSTPGELRSFIERLSIDELESRRAGALRAAEELDWDNEIAPVQRLYAELTSKRGRERS